MGSDRKRRRRLVKVGAHTYGHEWIAVRHWGEDAVLRFGRYCSIGRGLTVFLGGNHRTDWVTTYPFGAFPDEWPGAAELGAVSTSRGNVIVGNGVWIGEGVTILSGVTIGDGAAIGSRAVVTRDVHPFSLVAGNPARLIRFLRTSDERGMLHRMQWWNWPDDRVREAVPMLCSPNVDALYAWWQSWA